MDWFPSEEVCEILSPVSSAVATFNNEKGAGEAAIDLLNINGLYLHSFYDTHMKVCGDPDMFQESGRVLNSTHMNMAKTPLVIPSLIGEANDPNELKLNLIKNSYRPVTHAMAPK